MTTDTFDATDTQRFLRLLARFGGLRPEAEERRGAACVTTSTRASWRASPAAFASTLKLRGDCDDTY
jgi:hypothetical protein